MTKNSIKVYARLKPDQFQKLNYQINQKKSNQEELIFHPLSSDNGRFYNNLKFTFDKILNECTPQDLVFQLVCEPIIESILNGYNGTVFTYGQTGSGKTHTMTGSPNEYKDRGIIPRTIQHIFNRIKNSPTVMYTVYISYLEIYNECGFDLLDQKYNATKLEDLQRVVALEDSHGNTHLRNLSVWPVKAETDALQLLFLGDTNRAIAETPMNPYSSRSHCIFTLHVGCRKPNSNVMRRGKLHLVDLAGSERISKTQPSATKNITEAKHINLSLYFLEQVITALSESKRHHVPYRNSMLTAVLRDSLGGNCLTSMIATLSLSVGNYEETISTCKFAQRVATVSNEVAVNEEIDPEQEVIQLKAEIVNLKCQLKVYTDKDFSESLTEEERQECNDFVINYIRGSKNESDFEPDMRKIQHCFKVFKTLIQSAGFPECRNRQQSASSTNSVKADDKTIETYKQLLQQRDREIEVLVNLLKKEKQKQNCCSPETSISVTDVIDSPKSSTEDLSSPSITAFKSFSIGSINSEAQREAFNVYIREIDPQPEIEYLKNTLITKMKEARMLRSKIEKAKEIILSLRKDLNQADLFKQNQKDEVTKTLRAHVEIVKENIQKLHALKNETDHIKHNLNNANVRLINRFKQWWESNPSSKSLNNSKEKNNSRNSTKNKEKIDGKNEKVVRFTSGEDMSDSALSSDTVLQEKQISSMFYNSNTEVEENEDMFSWNFDQIDEKLALLENERLKNVNAGPQKKKSRRPLENEKKVPNIFVREKYTDSEDEKSEVASSRYPIRYPNTHEKISANSEQGNSEMVSKLRPLKNKKTCSRKDTSTEVRSEPAASALYNRPKSNTKERMSGKSITSPRNQNKNWEEFMKNVPLTGDPEIDAEITKFYRQKFEGN